MVIDILKNRDCITLCDQSLFEQLEEDFIVSLVECRKLNEENNSRSAWLIRTAARKISKIITIFAKSFGEQFGSTFWNMYKRSLPYFPANYADHPTVFNLVIVLIAEVSEHLKSAIIPYGSEIVPLLAKQLKDEKFIVLHNISYAIGTVFGSAKGAFKEYYDIILPDLLRIASFSADDQDRLGARDNALSALAKMVGADPFGIALEEITPIILHGLPLIEDRNEDADLYPALLSALSARSEIIQQNKPLLEEKLNLALNDNAVPESTKSLISEWKSLHIIE